MFENHPDYSALFRDYGLVSIKVNMKKKLTLSGITVFVIALLLTIVTSNVNWGKERWKGVLEADAKGYYAYLPAVFIYNDLNFGFFDHIEKEKYYNKNLFYDYRAFSNGAYISKYYAGTALVQLPFFLLAHALTLATNADADGYSEFYMMSVNLTAIFCLLMGLFFLNRTLTTYGISDRIRTIVLIASVFGTNLFYYATSESGMSHVYSFAFISMFYFYARQLFLNFRPKYILSLSILLGIIVLIRPVNGLILLIIPFAAGNPLVFREGISRVFKETKYLLAGVLLFFGLVSLQLIYYKLATGSFFVYSYIGEGFNFLNPHFVEILFSYKKGLFLYTPMFLLSFTGCIYLWKKQRFMFFTWLAFFLIITFIFSSWSNWWYGGSFSSRVYVEYIPLFMVLLAIAMQHTVKRVPAILLITSVIFIVLVCQVQTYQYRYYQIHWSDMNRDKYWEVFMRVDRL